jgi:hypothetical protein
MPRGLNGGCLEIEGMAERGFREMEFGLGKIERGD